jgi:RNA polymerase sigma-70 factor (ECF subfamily)
MNHSAPALEFALPAEGTPHASASEAEVLLVQRAVADPAAFTEIYRLHYPMIGAYLFRRCGDEHATEDMLAEVFLAALKALPKFRAGDVPLRFWLYRIATNVANLRWRELAQRAEIANEDEDLELVAHGEGPDDVLERKEACASTQRALLSLPADLQAVLSLYYFQDLCIEDVARVLECPEGTVKSRLSRARDAFTLALQRRSRS